MDRESGGAIAATVVAGAAAATAFHVLGVICMGAFGGALFALMNSPKMLLGDGARLFTKRALFSFFTSWGASLVVERFLTTNGYIIPEMAVFMSVSFVLACPGEFSKEVSPVLVWAGKVVRFFTPKGKED